MTETLPDRKLDSIQETVSKLKHEIPENSDRKNLFVVGVSTLTSKTSYWNYL